MTLATQAEFADQHGVSKPAVTGWKRKGYLRFQGLKIDVEASDKILSDHRLGRFKAGRAVNSPVNSVNSAVNLAVNSGPSSVNRRLGDDGADDGSTDDRNAPDSLDDLEAGFRDFLIRVLRGEFATHAEAARIKENALAGKHILELRAAAGELIDVGIAESEIYEVMRAERDAWTGWSAKVAPQVAAELGVAVDQVVEVLTRHVTDHLNRHSPDNSQTQNRW
jgi:hypothetical protein